MRSKCNLDKLVADVISAIKRKIEHPIRKKKVT